MIAPTITAANSTTPLVVLRDVTKVFPPNVVALSHVSLSIVAGEIHAIVGENGAGKSTLMKVMCGEVAPDSGTMHWKGSSARFASARQAMDAGIGMVHQELLLVDELSVWENMVLGVEPVNRFGTLNRQQARTEVCTTLQRCGLALPPDALAAELSLAARQKLEIAKLLHRNVDLLILDEPTASLAPQETVELFSELRRLRDAGRTLVFVSHRLGEVLELADRVSVLRNGALVATVAASDTDKAGLARLMVERDVLLTAKRSPTAPGRAVLRVEQLHRKQLVAGGLGPIDLVVNAGEIVGVAGVEGNGQSQLVAAVIGDHQRTYGRVVVDGVDITTATILERRRHLSYVAAERKLDGMAVHESVLDNARMTHHRLTPSFASIAGRILNTGRAGRFVDELKVRFGITMDSSRQPIGSLSGGNQQKVILGRELALDRALVVLDQPTRGLDVGSIQQVHQLILSMRAEGRGVLLISADLDELFQLADRLVVLHRGVVALEGATASLTIEEVGTAMLSGSP